MDGVGGGDVAAGGGDERRGGELGRTAACLLLTG
jgi:hypothetical protein